MTNTTDKLIIQSETRGVQQTTNEVQGLSKAMDGVTVASQNVEKSTTSVEGKFAALERRLGTSAAQARQFEKDQKTINAAVAQNPEFAARAADAQAALAARYVNATKASAEFAKSTGLARHELINLSRQFQDVGVSLQAGQSPFTVLIQQGSQIADVFASSGGTVKGFLGQIAEGAGRVLTVGRVAFGGVAAAVGTAAFALNDYLDKQRSVERSLIGAGRRSGASASDIEGIAQRGGASTDRSISEVRDAALEFAKIGSIHKSVIEEMTTTTRNFAIATGQSSREAAQSLASAFTNLKGLDEINQKFNFLDGPTRNLIERFLSLGQTTEAAALANRKLSEALSGADATLSGTEKGWQAVTKAISDYWTLLGEVTARQLNLKPLDTSEQVAQLEANLERIKRIREGLFDRGRSTDSADTAIARITAEIEKLSAARQKNGQNQDLNKISLEAQSAANGLNPLRGKILEIEGALQRLRTAQSAGFLNPEIQQAVNQYDLILQNLKNQETAVESLRAKYPGMTSEFAKQVEALKDQNALLKARENGNEATVAAAIAYKNAIAAGATETEAAAIRAETLKNNLLQAASAAGNMSNNIQLGAVTGGEWMSAAEAEAAAGTPKSDFAPSEMTQSGLFSLDPLKSLQASNIFGGAFGFETGASRVNSSWLNAMKNAEAQFLGGSSLKEDKIRGLQMQISALQPTLIDHPENRWQIRSLQRSMEELMNSVDENTSALDKVTLNPLYNGRDALKVGYMHAARGLDVIAQGPTSGDQIPFHAMVNGGERITITPAGQAGNDNSRSVVQHNTFNITGSQSTSRRSSRQLGQRYGQMMAALS